MSTYAIGDIQGCYDEFQKLLELIQFDPSQDSLWLAGDLVNRGPKSLETLRLVKSLGNSAITVLGNHDMHLIATAVSAGKTGKKDTLHAILKAPDCDELIDWLRHQALFHHDEQFCMLHAGIPPQWNLEQTIEMARMVEHEMQGPDYRRFFHAMYGNKPNLWNEKLGKTERLRFAVNCFTRLRFCTIDGALDFAHKGPPGTQPAELIPWFAVPNRKSRNMRIIFGHWSTLGFYEGDNCISIDTGCLWGGKLTALRLTDTPTRFEIDCIGHQTP
jgi:bis(5'-nucleosyl)-tetraphosphatase (symmetrical)